MFAPKAVDLPLSFEEVLSAEHKAIRSNEDPNKFSRPLTALCISGGGIRSATFGLGVIQALAEKGILGSFDYLSTVSGGGYIGSWLTAWKQRQQGLDKIVLALKPAAALPSAKEPDPVQHLREYNNYLSPKLGIFSADSWTLAATVARNMLLNWLVLVPMLMVVLMAPRLLLALARMGEHLTTAYGLSGVQQTRLEYVIATLSSLAFAVATFNTLRYLPGVGKVKHTEIDFIKYCLLPIIGAALLFITMESWITGGDEKLNTTLTLEALLLTVPGTTLASWAIYLTVYFKKTDKGAGLIAGLSASLLLMGLVTAVLTWLLVSKIYLQMEWESYVSFSPPLALIAFALPVILFVGFTSNVLHDDDREWLSRAGAWLLLFILGWSGICGLVLMAPTWAFELPTWGLSFFAAAGVAGGILTALGGFSLKSKQRQRSNSPDPEHAPTVSFFRYVIQTAALIFGCDFSGGTGNSDKLAPLMVSTCSRRLDGP